MPPPLRVLVSIGREPGRRKEFVPGYPPRAEACWQRDRALAASQLNLVPASRASLLRPIDPTIDDASVFPSPEPAPITLPDLEQVDSRLARWARGERSRLWLIAAGSMLVMIGLLPWNQGDRS